MDELDEKTIRIFGKELLKQIVEWIGLNLKPDDVFDFGELCQWAELQGYVEDEELPEEETR